LHGAGSGAVLASVGLFGSTLDRLIGLAGDTRRRVAVSGP
jgi:hypothetical protein